MESSAIKTISACNVEMQKIKEFFSIMYPTRMSIFPDHYRWLYRSSYLDDRIPFVSEANGKIVAHAGMIPFKLIFDDKEYDASWFMDLAVLPEFRGKGLAVSLTNQIIEQADITFGFPNEKSIGVLRKTGFVESSDSYMHIFPLKPFDHPRMQVRFSAFFRKTFNLLTRPVLFAAYKRFFTRDHRLERMTEGKAESIVGRTKDLKIKDAGNNEPLTKWDADYAKWRIVDSPNFSKYLFFIATDINAMVLPNDNHGRYIDILWISEPNHYSAIKTMIATLSVWGMKNNYAYLRFFTSSGKLSKYLKKRFICFISHPPFLYFAKKSELLSRLRGVNWNWQLIDGDFEKIISNDIEISGDDE